MINIFVQNMLGQLEYQAQEITEKIGQLKALQEEMQRKEQLFQECSRQLQVIVMCSFSDLNSHGILNN